MPDTAVEQRVRFEGMSGGTEIWGMTQANFLVSVPGRHAKEAAIMLNDVAAKVVAEAVGHEDTEEFRRAVAVATGLYWLEHQLAAGAPIESAGMVSAGFLREHPDLFQHLKRSMAA